MPRACSIGSRQCSTDGPGFCDGVFLAHAHRAAASCDGAALRDIAELAAAFAPSRERHLETTSQGRAFIDIARSAWNCDGLDLMIASCEGPIVYPVAVGLVSAAHAIPLALDHACIPSCGDVELDICRRAADSARTDRQPARAGDAGACRCRHRQSRADRDARRPRQRDVSRRSWPACGTRPSIRGCSGHDGSAHDMSSPRMRGPIRRVLACGAGISDLLSQ